MKQKFIKILIALNIVWSISAIIFDYPQFIIRPIYLWPILIICPLYPALLAYAWYKIDAGKKINYYLYALGVIGSTYFGLSAMLFYPLSMTQEGFSWLAVGAIFWVAFYGVQGAYLLWVQKNRLHLLPVLVIITYLLIKLYFDWRYFTFGYMITDQWQDTARNLMAGFQLFVLLLLTVTALYRNYNNYSPAK